MEESGFWLVMSQRDGFSSGFLLGTMVGGVIGGVVGALLAARQLNASANSEEGGLNSKMLDSGLDAKQTKKKGFFKAASDRYTDIEAARRSLEDKIAQLNDAIDDVRHQLGGVNGNPLSGVSEQSIVKEPRRQG